jgi:hypothetical protein
MTADEVLKIATKFINEFNSNGFTYKLGEPKRDGKRADEWNVLVFYYNDKGGYLEGPGIIIVNEKTGTARFF